MISFLESLDYDSDCMRILDDNPMMLAHHKGNMERKAVRICQQAVKDNSE